MNRRTPFTLPRAALLWIPLVVLGVAGCDGDGSHEQPSTVFVEVTSSPSGLAVTIQLNSASYEATTPVAQSFPYVASCDGVSADGDCVLFGTAEVHPADRGRTVGLTLCLSAQRTRECESKSFWSVGVTLTFDP